MGVLRRGARRPGAEAAEPALELPHEIVVTDVAGGDRDHALGAILAVHEGMQLRRGERLDRLRGAEDRAADGLVAEGRLGEAVEDDVVGRIVGGADLLQDDMLLALQLLRVELRFRQDVGQNIDGQRHVVAKHPHVEEVVSTLVAALISPPTFSISEAICQALRRSVPLKAMCSSR